MFSYEEEDPVYLFFKRIVVAERCWAVGKRLPNEVPADLE